MQGITIVFDTITVRRDSGIAFDTWHQNYYVPSVLTAGQMLNVQCYGSPLRATYVSVFESNASPAELNGMLVMPAHDAIISSEPRSGNMTESKEGRNIFADAGAWGLVPPLRRKRQEKQPRRAGD